MSFGEWHHEPAQLHRVFPPFLNGAPAALWRSEMQHSMQRPSLSEVEIATIIRQAGVVSDNITNDADQREWRRLVAAKPAELPFEQPTRFRFVLNLKTANAMMNYRVRPSDCCGGR